uniref:Uncharacterized protein n=1 Tax=Acrobeloides nanus TaxID=290746 RepID=A0A914E6I1_9BILA
MEKDDSFSDYYEYSERYNQLKTLVSNQLSSNKLPFEIEVNTETLQLLDLTQMHPINLIEQYFVMKNEEETEFIHYGYELSIERGNKFLCLTEYHDVIYYGAASKKKEDAVYTCALRLLDFLVAKEPEFWWETGTDTPVTSAMVLLEEVVEVPSSEKKAPHKGNKRKFSMSESSFDEDWKRSKQSCVDVKLSKVDVVAVSQVLYDDLLCTQIDAQVEESLLRTRLLYKQSMETQNEKPLQPIGSKSGWFISAHTNQILDEVSEVICQIMVEKVSSQETKFNHQRVAEQLAHSQTNAIIDEVLVEEVKIICQRELDYMSKKLQQIAENLNKLWLRQFFDHWRDVVQRKKMRKQRIREVFEALSMAKTNPSRFYDPSTKLPIRTTKRLSEEELDIKFARVKLQQNKNRRLAKKYFTIWLNKTRWRVRQKSFLKRFGNAVSPNQVKEPIRVSSKTRKHMIPFRPPPIFTQKKNISISNQARMMMTSTPMSTISRLPKFTPKL